MRMMRIVVTLLMVILYSGCTFTSDKDSPDQTQRIQLGDPTQASINEDPTPPLPPLTETVNGDILETNIDVSPTATALPTEIVIEKRSLGFVAESGTPTHLPAFMHSEMGCAWMGVGGQVFDRNGQPLLDLVVLLQGTMEAQPISLFALTGSATALGPSGFEFMLSDRPIATNGTLYLTLYDPYGNPLSGNVYISTLDQCELNLTLLNFKKSLKGIFHLFSL